MIKKYSYELDQLNGKGFERNSVNWTWEKMKDWMTPIPNVPVIKGSEKWIYRIIDQDNKIVFEGTIDNFIDEYL